MYFITLSINWSSFLWRERSLWNLIPSPSIFLPFIFRACILLLHIKIPFFFKIFRCLYKCMHIVILFTFNDISEWMNIVAWKLDFVHQSHWQVVLVLIKQNSDLDGVSGLLSIIRCPNCSEVKLIFKPWGEKKYHYVYLFILWFYAFSCLLIYS